MIMKITNESILRDIAGFNGRIQDTERALAKLKTNPPKTKKLLKLKKAALLDEIKHIRKLMSIAAEALE